MSAHSIEEYMKEVEESIKKHEETHGPMPEEEKRKLRVQEQIIYFCCLKPFFNEEDRNKPERFSMIFKLPKKPSKNQMRKMKRYPKYRQKFIQSPFIIKQMKEQGLNAEAISELTHMTVDKVLKIFSE